MDKELFKISNCPLKPSDTDADSIIGVPYSLSLEGTTKNFKKRVNEMMSTHQNYDAPTLYYFMHAQMDWIDALGGSSISHPIKSFLEEHKFPYLNRINLSKKLVKYSLLLILIALTSASVILNSYPLLLISFALIILGLLTRIKFYGLNARKHNKQMAWLNKTHGNKLWATDLSTLAQYYDIRKKSVIKIKPGYKFEIDTSQCFEWSREIPVTIELSGIKDRITSYYAIRNKKKIVFNRNFKQENDKLVIYELKVNPKHKRTFFGLIKQEET